MKRRAFIAIALAAATLAGCGGSSKEDQAKTTVCNARADIAKQVDTLKGMTLTTGTLTQVQTSLKAIGDDLSTIKNAQGDLSDQRRSEVEQANKSFQDQVKGTLASVGTTTSITEAKSQVQAALQQIATAYQQTFSKIDCS
jgi:hypothetical protein